MPTELQKLANAVEEIRKGLPAHGKRYSTIVENPFESGYWPPAKRSKRAPFGQRKKRATARVGG